MAAAIQITHNIGKAVDTIKRLDRDSQYALRTSATQTAFQARTAISRELETKLKNPIASVAKAYRYKPATDLMKPVALLYVPKRQQNIIESVTVTGKNIASAVTRDARNQGIIGGSQVLTPTRAVKPNSKGNVGRPKYARFRQGGAKVRGGGQTRAGVFYGSGKSRAKVLIATDIPRKYTPPVNAEKFIRSFAAKKLPALYKAAYDKNVARTLSKALGA